MLVGRPTTQLKAFCRDNVYVEGGTLVNHNVQTTTIPAGGAVMVGFRAETPSTILFVDHAISRVFNKGAVAGLRITGEASAQLFSRVGWAPLRERNADDGRFAAHPRVDVGSSSQLRHRQGAITL